MLPGLLLGIVLLGIQIHSKQAPVESLARPEPEPPSQAVAKIALP